MITAKQMIQHLTDRYDQGEKDRDGWIALKVLFKTNLHERTPNGAHIFANEVYWADQRNTALVSDTFEEVFQRRFRPIPKTERKTCFECKQLKPIRITSWHFNKRTKEHYCDEHAPNWKTQNAAWQRKYNPQYKGEDATPVRYRRRGVEFPDPIKQFFKDHDIDD